MRVVLYYPYIRTAHSSEKTVIFTNRKTAESENRHSKRMQRRGGNILSHPKEANRKYPIDEARDCPRGPAERRKRKKHKVKARFSVHFPRSGSVMLRLKSENLRSKLRRMPMLRALPPLTAGILLADHYVLPLWLLVGGFLVCGILALLADDRGRKPRHPGSHSAFRHDRHRTGTHSRSADRHSGRIRNRRPGTPLRTGRQNGLRRIAPRLRNSETGEWLPAAGNLVVRCDSSTVLNPGDRAVVRGKIYLHRPSRRLRTADDPPGIRGTLYLNRSSLLLRDTCTGSFPRSISPCSCTNGPSHGSTVCPWRPTNRPSATL